MADLSQATVWHRQVAALATAADRLGVATMDLPAIRARLLAQQLSLNEAAARAGAPLPPLMPTPAEIAAATPAFGDFSAPVVARAVQSMLSTLDAADAVLAGALVPAPVPVASMPLLGAPTPAPATTGAAPNPPRRWPVGVRNGLIYGAFAGLVAAMQIALFTLIGEESLPFYAPLCLIVLPVFAWAAGWFTISLAFRTAPGTPGPTRSWRLGLVISMLPNLLLCAAVGVLFLAH